MTQLTYARRTVTVAAAALNDADGVKTSAASSASPVAFDASDYDGALVNDDGTQWLIGLPRTVTISRSAAVASYTVDPIVLTGTWRGSTVTESLVPEDADGNDIIRGTQLWDAPPTIAIPAQVDTSGAFTIGSGDIGAPSGGTFAGVEVAAAGQLNLQYEGAVTDSFAVPAALVGYVKPVAPQRVLTDPALTAPTTVGITLYLY